ncbi:LAFA_0F14422g1_1 [Lachancea sp. 'fantastica']|nr:LAFA_0F14422g1_1 [Lachancea sp. 'fantastica']
MTEYTFKWPKGPNEVLLTGDFDNWSGSLPLVKNALQGDFAITMPISGTPEEKFRFKFIVDGDWQTSNEFPTETSRDGIVNNSVSVAWFASQAAAAAAMSQASSEEGPKQSKIPEIGLNLVAPEVAAPVLGTQAPQKAQPAPRSNKKNKKKKIQIKRRIRRNKKTGERTVLSEERSEIKSGTDTDTYETEETATATATSREETPLSANEGEAPIVAVVETGHTKSVQNGFQSTVMPSQENQQQTLGEPGIAIVPNPQEIKEFSEIRDVDQNELNERLNRELAAKDHAEGVKKPETDEDLGHISLKPEAGVQEPDHSVLEFPVKEKDTSAPEFPVALKEESEVEAIKSPDYSAVESDLSAPALKLAPTQESVPKAAVQEKSVTSTAPEDNLKAAPLGATALPLGAAALPLGAAVIPPVENADIGTLPPVEDKEVKALPPVKDADVKALPPVEDKEVKALPPVKDADVKALPPVEEADVKALPPVKEADVKALPPVEEADVKALPPVHNKEVQTLPPAQNVDDLESSQAQTAAAVVAADVANEAQEKVDYNLVPAQQDVTPETNSQSKGQTSSVKTVKNFDISQQPETSAEKAAMDKNAVESSPTDVEIVVVEGELDQLPPKKTSSAVEPAVLSEAPPSAEEPTGVVKGVPGATDLVGTESEDKFEAEAQAGTSAEQEPDLISEEIGVITSPEQEAELIQKTLDPKHGKPGETTELLVVEGDIPPSQVAEYQEASEAAAAEAVQKQKPEEVIVEQAPIAKETAKPQPQKPVASKQKATPASPEKKKKKKGLFSKIKKIFN